MLILQKALLLQPLAGDFFLEALLSDLPLFLEAHLLIIFSAFGEAESLLLEKRQLVEEIDTMNRLRH